MRTVSRKTRPERGAIAGEREPAGNMLRPDAALGQLWTVATAPFVVRLACASVLFLAACQTKPPPPITDTSALEVEAFVRQTYIHGVPYNAARRFDARVVPVLWRMLADPAEEPHWPNIAVTLAIVGDERVTKRLIEYVRDDYDRALSPAHYAAKTAALMALGYHAHNTEDPYCLDYLARCSDPAYWHALDLQWRAPFPQSPDERNNQLATLAVLGLALSGSPDAEKRLEALRQLCRTPEGERLRTAVGDVLDEAIKACRTIQQDGLGEYCRSVHP
jgi:hypothetical protein